MEEVDARGLSCPLPIVKTKEVLSSLKVGEVVRILVDNPISRDNVLRFVKSQGAEVKAVYEKEGIFKIEVCKVSVGEEKESGTASVVFIGSDRIGRGDDELGRVLIVSALSALAEVEPKPKAIVLMNSGVKLAVEGSKVLEKLRRLEDVGIKILVCGTCLDYFNLKDSIAVGEVSNMFTILETFLKSGNVVSL